MIVLGAQANSGDDPPLAHRIVLFEPHRRGPCPTLQVPRHDQGLHPRDRCSCAVPIAIASVVRQAVRPPVRARRVSTLSASAGWQCSVARCPSA